MRFRFQMILLSALLVGCATTVGPLDSPGINRILAESIGIDESDIMTKSQATWYASYLDKAPPKNLYSNPDPGITPDGVLICTNIGLFFQVWRKEVDSYKTLFSLRYSDISTVELLNNGLVLYFGHRGGKTYVLQVGGSLVDKHKTRQIYDLVKERVH